MDDLEIVLLSKKDHAQILRLMEEAYTPREPVLAGLHCTFEEVRPLSEMCILRSYESEVNVGIRDKSSGDIVAFVICLILTPKNNEVIQKDAILPSEKCNTYLKIIADLCSKVSVFEDGKYKKQLEVQILCVHPSYGKRGLARKLIMKTEELAREAGCDVATVQSVNCVTEHIVSKLGYKTCHKVEFSSLKKENGEYLLDMESASRNGTDHMSYMMKAL